MKYEKIVYEVEDRLATITLNHPENRNALSQHLLAEFTDAVNRVRKDKEAGAQHGDPGCVCPGHARHPLLTV